MKELFRHLVESRKDVLIPACKQKSKFEGWLKFELISLLSKKFGSDNVIIEGSYPDSKSKADIVIKNNERRFFIELKTVNTNWKVKGVANKTRPIEKNVSGVINDIEKIKNLKSSITGVAAFVFSPVPELIWRRDRDKLIYHLSRIEEAGNLPSYSLINNADYIPMNELFGIVSFIN